MVIRALTEKIKTKGVYFIINAIFDRVTFPVIKALFPEKRTKNIIVIESHNDFDCNGGAFYDYLIENQYNNQYKIVWIVKNSVNFSLPKNVIAFNIAKISIRKNYYICRAKYFLSDDKTIAKIWPTQVSVYCTHGGCTFKNVKGHLGVSNTVDYILSSSRKYDPYMCDNYSVPFPNERMLHIGFPSNDVFYKKNIDEYAKLRKKPFKQVVLWMPTFRRSKSGRNDSVIELPFGLPLITKEAQFEILNNQLLKNDQLLVVKLHPMQDLNTINRFSEYSNITFINSEQTKQLNLDVYRMMACSDGLISDYSSAAYSYILLNRPIGFILTDLKDYKLGLTTEKVDGIDVLPGHHIITFDDFINYLQDLASGNDRFKNERNSLKSWLYEIDDGNSCERLARFLKLKGD